MRWLNDVECELRKMNVKGWVVKRRGGQDSPRVVVASGRKLSRSLKSYISKYKATGNV
jgi:hypothetical protein